MNVYLDNNATSRLDPVVLDAMLPYLSGSYGNPSSLYSLGRDARKAIEESREALARALGASSRDAVCFTGSGTEADNMAIRGAASALRGKGRHIVTSAVEHPAVLNTCGFLEREGFSVTYVKPDTTGLIGAEAVADALRDDTIIISVMHANNETGTINPIGEIGDLARARGVLFHTDAVQSFCKLPFTVDAVKADLVSLSAHKINGPKGIGALYIREGSPINPLIYGGHQESGMRAGTENVAAIVGFAESARLNRAVMTAESSRVAALRNRLERELLARVPHLRVNGNAEQRLPNTLNLSFPFIESESLLLELDLKGVAVSSGSACTSGTGEPSHVLLAMGIPHEICRGALRFSLGKGTTDADIDFVIGVLPGIVERIRAMSPFSAE